MTFQASKLKKSYADITFDNIENQRNKLMSEVHLLDQTKTILYRNQLLEKENAKMAIDLDLYQAFIHENQQSQDFLNWVEGLDL